MDKRIALETVMLTLFMALAFVHVAHAQFSNSTNQSASNTNNTITNMSAPPSGLNIHSTTSTSTMATTATTTAPPSSTTTNQDTASPTPPTSSGSPLIFIVIALLLLGLAGVYGYQYFRERKHHKRSK